MGQLAKENKRVVSSVVADQWLTIIIRARTNGNRMFALWRLPFAGLNLSPKIFTCAKALRSKNVTLMYVNNRELLFQNPLPTRNAQKISRSGMLVLCFLPESGIE